MSDPSPKLSAADGRALASLLRRKDDEGPNREVFRFICSEAIPHNRELGLELIDLWRGGVVVALPYHERLIGDPARGVLAGGAITSLLDATCGLAVMAAVLEPTPVATLDLRIDYLRPATPERGVYARADCYKLTRHVAFVRATAYDDDPNDPVAAAAGSFMLHGPGAPIPPGEGEGD